MDLTDGLALIWAQVLLWYGNFEALHKELNAVVAGAVGFVVTYHLALRRHERKEGERR